MALEKWIISETMTFEANADLSAKQHLFMKAHTTEDQIATAGAGDKVLGILMDAPAAAGRAGRLLTEGVGMVVAGTTIAINDYVKSDANGKATATTSAGDEVCGRALGAANASEEFALKIMRFRY